MKCTSVGTNGYIWLSVQDQTTRPMQSDLYVYRSQASMFNCLTLTLFSEKKRNRSAIKTQDIANLSLTKYTPVV